MKRYSLLSVVAVIWVALMVLPGGAAFGEEELEKVKIGILCALTGPAGPYGLPLLQGVEIFKKHLDEDGGFIVNPQGCTRKPGELTCVKELLPGGKRYTFEIVKFDTRYDPKLCVTGAHKMVEENVMMTIGAPMNVAGIFAANRILGPAKIPQMCHVIDLKVKNAKFSNVFLYGSIEERKVYVGQFLGPEGLDIKTVAWLETIGQNAGMVELYSEEVEKKYGIKTVAREKFEMGTTDFYTILAKLKKANPDVVYLACGPSEAALILKQRIDMDWPVQCVGIDVLGASGAPMIKLGGKAGIDGHIESVWNFEPEKVYEPWEAKVLGLDMPMHKRWAETSIAMFGRDWYSPYQGTGYTYAQLLVDAMQRAGTVTDHAKILEALENMPLLPGCELAVQYTPDCHQWIVQWVWVMYNVTDEKVGTFTTESFAGSQPIAKCGKDWELTVHKPLKIKDIRAGKVPGTAAYGKGY